MTNVNNLPLWLRENGRFCLWRYESRPGEDKPQKVPYNPLTAARVNSTDSSTFCPFSCAEHVPEGYDGIGVGVFNRLGAIDIDHCIDNNGDMSDMAADVVQTMNAYTEYSPSGKGLRILFLAPDFQYDKTRYYINNQQLGLEVYISGATSKFLTVTGNALTPGVDLENRNAQVQQVLEKYMVRPVQETPTVVNRKPVALSDEELIEKAKSAQGGEAFKKLWRGDISGFSSHSEADIALCDRLAFWTNGDPERVDCLFRLSGLMRDKWDRPTAGSTYGWIAVTNAVNTLTQGYDPEKYQRPTAEQAFSTIGEGLELISARELQSMYIPPTVFIVDQLLTPGIAMIAAKSKIGKSWMVLDLCISVATGRPFLGYRTRKFDCLYLALEDSKSRLKKRMSKLLQGESAPEGFYFTTKAPDTENGLMEKLKASIEAHPAIKLIVIDTLQKIRPPVRGKDGAYAEDYRVMSALKDFADDHGVCILLVHHLRKLASDGDPFDKINGTTGILGALDTAIVLDRQNRADEDTTFSATGRDIESQDKIIRFDRESCRWEMKGDADRLTELKSQLAYRNSPIVQTVNKLLEESPDGKWSGTAGELMKEGERIIGTELAPTVYKMGHLLNALAPQFKPNGIQYSPVANGNAGRKHYFSLYREKNVDFIQNVADQ